MHGSDPALDSRLLLEHFDWVRRLARRLVHDESLADDLSQETWLAAMKNPPPGDGRLRAWLTGVCKKLALQNRRGEARRHQRERSVAHERAAGAGLAPDSNGGDELCERARAQRELVDHVLLLDEPYRSAVLMRYFEDLSPTEIARREKLPVATVKTRLRRGLERLRERLGRTHGSRNWMALFVPLAGTRDAAVAASLGAGAAAAATTGGTLIVSTKTLVATASMAVALSLGGLWLSVGRTAGLDPALAAAEPRAATDLLEPDALASAAQPAAESSTRSADVAQPLDEPTVTVPAAPAPAHVESVRGRVIDIEEQPVPHVVVRTRRAGHYRAPGVRAPAAAAGQPEDDPSATTDAAGEFELELPDHPAHVFVDSEHFATVLSAAVRGPNHGGEGSEAVVVVAPVATQAGTVVDAAGAPVAGAEVRVKLPGSIRHRFGALLETSSPLELRTTTDATGSFGFPGAPAFAGCQLEASSTGYVAATVELGTTPKLDHVLVLNPVDGAADTLLGEVLDPVGRPVAGAYVGLGNYSTRSDEEGRFQLELSAQDGTTLLAIHEGFLPAELERGDAWPQHVTLQLGGTPLEISGRVVDASGAPVAGAKVWTIERQHFGYVAREAPGVSLGMPVHVEGLIAGDGSPRQATCDSDGRFHLTGLLARDYRLQALDESTLEIATTAPIAAGTSGVELVVPAPPDVSPVEGRVVNTRGEPFPGAQVVPRRANPRADQADALFIPLPQARGRFTMTDSEGRFDLGSIRRDGLHLEVWAGFDHDSLDFEVPENGDADDLELVLAARCHLRVSLKERPDRADGFRILDANGEPVTLSLGLEDLRMHLPEAHFENGESDVVGASENGCTLVLLEGDTEVERHPLRLVPGELNEIEL